MKGSRLRPLRNLVTNLALAAVSLVVSLMLAEALARRFIDVQPYLHVSDDDLQWNLDHPTRRYALTPNYRGRLLATEFDVRIEINSLGLRGPEPNLDQRGFRHRVFALGDSFTFGFGVDYPQSIPARLEHHLEQAGTSAEVWNLGVPGYSLPPSILALEEYLDYEPAVVVLFFYAGRRASGANDLTGSVDFASWREERSEAAARARASGTAPDRKPWHRRIKKWVERRSALYNALLVRFGPQLRAWYHRLQRVPVREEELLEQGWVVVDTWLGRLARLSGSRRFRVIVAFVPEHPDVLDGFDDVAIRLGQLVNRYGFAYVDGFALLAERDVSKHYFPIDGHLNTQGCDILASLVAPVVGKSLDRDENRRKTSRVGIQ